MIVCAVPHDAIRFVLIEAGTDKRPDEIAGLRNALRNQARVAD
jgi:hypothetical protein